LPKVHQDETRTQGLDRLELIRFLQVAQTLTVHHGALAYLLGINALRASEAAAVRIEDYRETLRGHRVLHLVGKGNKPSTMPLTVPVLRVLEACRGQRTEGPLVLRPLSGKPIDRRDCYRMVARIAKAAGIPRQISPHSLHHAAITNALDAGVPLRDAQILARHADPRTTEHYDRARGNLDRHGVHFLTAYVAGVRPARPWPAARHVPVRPTEVAGSPPARRPSGPSRSRGRNGSEGSARSGRSFRSSVPAAVPCPR
jgi:integrase/recombinase XerD